MSVRGERREKFYVGKRRVDGSFRRIFLRVGLRIELLGVVRRVDIGKLVIVLRSDLVK